MKLANVKTAATRVISRTGLKLKKYSPEILMVAGTAAVIGGVVLACKATMKVDDVLEELDEDLGKIKKASELELDNYTEDDVKRDKVVAYAHCVGGFAKHYAPAAGLILFGLGCYMGAYGIMRKRNLALMAAYDGLQKAFSDYRNRVKERLGEEEEKELYYGSTDKTIGDDGVMRPVLPNGHCPSVYSRFFDETSTQWTRNAALNKMNLCNWQNWANDLLNAHGHLFLNEVYDMLGIARSREGAVVGWVKHGDGDGYVDFGIYDFHKPERRDFVNGEEYSILLDFNVDGVIYDKI